jgi:hypothetical protein
MTCQRCEQYAHCKLRGDMEHVPYLKISTARGLLHHILPSSDTPPPVTLFSFSEATKGLLELTAAFNIGFFYHRVIDLHAVAQPAVLLNLERCALHGGNAFFLAQVRGHKPRLTNYPLSKGVLFLKVESAGRGSICDNISHIARLSRHTV